MSRAPDGGEPPIRDFQLLIFTITLTLNGRTSSDKWSNIFDGFEWKIPLEAQLEKKV